MSSAWVSRGCAVSLLLSLRSVRETIEAICKERKQEDLNGRGFSCQVRMLGDGDLEMAELQQPCWDHQGGWRSWRCEKWWWNQNRSYSHLRSMPCIDMCPLELSGLRLECLRKSKLKGDDSANYDCCVPDVPCHRVDINIWAYSFMLVCLWFHMYVCFV